MKTKRVLVFVLPATLLLASLLIVGCSINPATGKRQLTLVSESQEREMGRQYDEQLVQQLGLYEDPELQSYVQGIGRRLAASSERPDLSWSFRVVDDPVVNAFALPGGYIYVTRGILAHMNSEAELAAVLGHEIGHVTARHSVNQMSKAQLAQLGLGVGAVMAPERMDSYGGLLQTDPHSDRKENMQYLTRMYLASIYEGRKLEVRKFGALQTWSSGADRSARTEVDIAVDDDPVTLKVELRKHPEGWRVQSAQPEASG